jgi:hypothetical protein
MTDERRHILDQVAKGTLSPEDAAARLDGLGNQSAGQASTATAEPAALAKVRVLTNFGTAEVIADPGVQEVVAEGPHLARREGDTVVIQSEDLDEGLSGFYFTRNRGADAAVFGWGRRPPSLRIRINPQLALDLSCSAGRVWVDGVRGPIRAEVSAGRVGIRGFASTIDLTTTAGKIEASGVLDTGSSRVRCETGKVSLHLEKGSSARIRARATLGSVVLLGKESTGSLFNGESREVTVGGGAANLDVETSVGKIEISSDVGGD